ncbi:hypothetical protein D3C84_1126870 [compost metagenome]
MFEPGHQRKYFRQQGQLVGVQFQGFQVFERLEEIRHIVIQFHVLERKVLHVIERQLRRQYRELADTHLAQIQTRHRITHFIAYKKQTTPTFFNNV